MVKLQLFSFAPTGHGFPLALVSNGVVSALEVLHTPPMIGSWKKLCRLGVELCTLALGFTVTHDLVELQRTPALDPGYRADAIVALGGDDGVRSGHALTLYQHGVAPRILLLATDSPAGPTGSPYPDLRGDLLERGGVPPARIRYDTRPTSTWEEALVTRAWAQTCGWKRVVVVTEAPHVARAKWAMRAVITTPDVNIDTIAAPRPESAATAARASPKSAVWHELQKLWYYRLVHGLGRCAADAQCLPMRAQRIECP